MAGLPYEVQMAANEATDGIRQWTKARKDSGNHDLSSAEWHIQDLYAAGDLMQSSLSRIVEHLRDA